MSLMNVAYEMRNVELIFLKIVVFHCVRKDLFETQKRWFRFIYPLNDVDK